MPIMREPLEPIYEAPFEPRFPCRVMPTRHCPAIYHETCDDGVPQPCARYESDDERPWYPELRPRT